MEDIPQPAPDPLEPGDIVRIYLAESDSDVPYHGMVCRIVERLEDDLGEVTGRNLDRYLYRVEGLSGDTIDPDFRHADLIPIDKSGRD